MCIEKMKGPEKNRPRILQELYKSFRNYVTVTQLLQKLKIEKHKITTKKGTKDLPPLLFVRAADIQRV